MSRHAFALLPVLLVSCGEKTPPDAAAEAPPPEDPVAAEVRAAMNFEMDPCEDFYEYACGGWLATTELPADKPIWGRSFSSIQERNRAFLKDLLERAAADPDAGDADWARMGHVYGSCLDTTALDETGLAPLQPWLDEIAAIEDADSLMTTLASLEKIGVSVLVGVWVDGDFKDPTLSIFHLNQTGLGLPDRDYYTKQDADSVQLIADYQAHLSQVLTMLGTEEDPASAGAQVLDLERRFAAVHMAKEDLRDPVKTYHKIDRDGLFALTPELDWQLWLDGIGAAEVTDINVGQPDTLQEQADILLEVLGNEPETVKAYLRTRLLASTASHLPTEWYDTHFDFYNRKVYGQQEPEPRWKRCVDTANGSVGEIVGRFYVEERFAGESKEIALAMIEGIQDAFEAGLPALEWMDEATRAAAVEKKSLLSNKIGYPDAWRDYSAFQTGEGAHLQNMLNSRVFEHHFWVDQAGKPVDKSLWFMAASQVNAYYHPIRAEMVFPAGILQPPFFSADFPMAMNYGGIGMVMGHELTHGFDDSGRKFDGHGKMVEWWPADVSERFEERAQCVADQYSGYSVAEGLNVNGQLTLGENIADIGGIRESYRAYKAWDAANGPEDQLLEEITNDQLFFVAQAQGWCSVASPEFEKMRVMSNPHSPSRFRVIGPNSNLPEFHEAFSCEVGTPMHPEETCEVW